MNVAEAPAAERTPVVALLGVLGRSALVLLADALQPIGIKPRHMGPLLALRDGPVSQQALGDAIHTDPTQLVVVLNELEGAGLVSRRRDEANRRRHFVELSPAGVARLTEALTRVDQTEERLLAGIDPAEREHLRVLIERIMTNAGAGSACDPAADETAGDDQDGCDGGSRSTAR